MDTLSAIYAIVHSMTGTPYIPGGISPAGTDCSGLASIVANLASGRPAFAGRFNTRTEEAALSSMGFRYGTAPGALNIGWNGGHTAVTLPDGTPVSSGESGGVRIGGGGAFQKQFTNHMHIYLPETQTAARIVPAPQQVQPQVEQLPLPAPEPIAPPVEFLPPPVEELPVSVEELPVSVTEPVTLPAGEPTADTPVEPEPVPPPF